MTLRGRLTTAFLVVVLGPVLLGSFFIGMTVATVSGDRTVERLDHAATTVRTAMGAMCRQLQAVADAVAVLPPDDRHAAAEQMVTRGLAADVRIAGGPVAPGGMAGMAALPSAAYQGERDCAGGQVADDAMPVTAIAAYAVQGDVTVAATERVDSAFISRLGGTSGAAVSLQASAGGPYARKVEASPGQPLPLVVTVPGSEPTVLYVVLAVAVVAVAGIAIVAARWLARSTTRPLEELAWAAGKVADGELGVRVPVGRDDEIGQLAGTFNRMTRELQTYVQALTASRDQLRGHLAILGDTLSSTHDLHRILQVILQTALSATGARAGVVLLIDPDENCLVARCAEGLTGPWDVPTEEISSLRVRLGQGILGAVAAGGEPRRGACGHGEGAAGEPVCKTYVAVPICAPAPVGDPLVPGEREASGQPATLGVLALYDRLGSDEFDDADLLTLRTFAGQAGIAVQNVRVHEEAQRLSLTDPLTGLWNYRCLQESLRREVERASRFGRMLTVLVLDLDHFKEVNDTYGHAAGDTVLSEFARRIRLGLREVDVAFRQGGEEFVVLLPETDAYGGIVVAERLGAAVRQVPVPVDGRRLDPSGSAVVERIAISVSIGIAVYPEHGVNAQQVLEAADDALYAAKSAGRDTYRLADRARAMSGPRRGSGDVRGRAEATVVASGGVAGKVPAPGGGAAGWAADADNGEVGPTSDGDPGDGGVGGGTQQGTDSDAAHSMRVLPDDIDGSRRRTPGGGAGPGGVTDASVSGRVRDGQMDHPGSVTGASGGPQPPRQGRGR
ncbi:diguanylate cyclase [Couchioplanes caeruleus]|uniref:diguanylate cyclase n=1 Tax=Couchioplanes caeruleus TaxID=56438 RepID=UPI00201C6DAF|nr:diguanylate cyclase [Couchioplanes caeruleus]UQU65516.1 diguanylate cyclase [Couchioplanes caeruleus]